MIVLLLQRTIELAIRSKKASSGRDVTRVTVSSERGKPVVITPPLGNTSGNKNVIHISKMNDETRNNIPNEVSGLLVPETNFDRQTHTYHMMTGLNNATHHMMTG